MQRRVLEAVRDRARREPRTLDWWIEVPSLRQADTRSEAVSLRRAVDKLAADGLIEYAYLPDGTPLRDGVRLPLPDDRRAAEAEALEVWHGERKARSDALLASLGVDGRPPIDRALDDLLRRFPLDEVLQALQRRNALSVD